LKIKIKVELTDETLNQIKEKLDQGIAIEEIMKDVKLNLGSI